MRYRTLAGGKGPEVSILCLGILPFGSTVDEQTSFAVLDRFAEAGGTFVDTSNNYSLWAPGGTGDESELLLGRWLRSRGARDRTVVATKVGARPPVGSTRIWPEVWEGLSAKVVAAGIEGSLRRLGTDHVDLYYAHIEDRAVPVAETVGAFAEVVRSGAARVIGASNHAAWRVAEARQYAAAHGLPAYTCVEQRHTYLWPVPGGEWGAQWYARDDMQDFVAAHDDMTLMAYGSLVHGAYSRADKPLLPPYDHPMSQRRLEVLREVAREAGATPNQTVLAWQMGGPLPIVPVVGVSSVAQLDEVLGAVELDLDPALRARLDAA
ncbi:Predicted oxidoreductase [Actinacidiphila yanglinensis]|uniref:Predicted oxidoreductase n=1 Tax=Actinacidiphila yanglinensis TaxID=310779 RepID=A0A1H6EDI1_9ACTN|nr:aldo/keto reductase [Actinacidiphila yanglinensis]SEG95867.1 Predicted oxidoreductase [Actinacidiphila yanglinensis]